MSKEKFKNINHTFSKGITLIALIITIIVMLILTGVALSITLGDNGLVNKAKQATEATEIAMDRDLLLSAVVGTIGTDGTVDLSAIVLPEGFTGSKGTYTSKNGHTFTVRENGEIIYNGENSGGGDETVGFNWKSVNLEVDTKTEYIWEDEYNRSVLNFTEDGKMILSSGGMILSTIDATNSDNIDQTTGNLGFILEIEGPVHITITMANENDINLKMILIEEGEEVSFPTTFKKTIVDNETIYSNEEVLKLLGITNNTGKYRGTWKKIGTENGKIKLVSTSLVTQYTLGFEDPKAIEAVSIVGTEPTEEEKLQRGIWSYKNVVSTLNTVAQEATGIAVARSIKIEDIYGIVGEENIYKDPETRGYGKMSNYYYNAEESKVYLKMKTGTEPWSEPYKTEYSSQIFVNDDGETVIIDSEGDEITVTNTYYSYYLTDEQKVKIGSLASEHYWLASPCVLSSSGVVHHGVRHVERASIHYSKLFYSHGRAAEYDVNQLRSACCGFST